MLLVSREGHKWIKTLTQASVLLLSPLTPLGAAHLCAAASPPVLGPVHAPPWLQLKESLGQTETEGMGSVDSCPIHSVLKNPAVRAD